MNAVNGARNSASTTAESTQPEEVIIHDRTETRILFAKLLRGVQVLIKAIFFMGCGAIAMALGRLGNLTKTDPDARTSGDLSPQEQPRGIVVPIFPIDNYNQLIPDCILENLSRLSTDQLWTVRNFETTHRNRNRIVEAIDQRLAKNS